MVRKPYTLEERPRWLVADFAEPWNVLSWTIVNGGFQRVQQVAWLFLKPHEIAGVAEPRDWMLDEMRTEALSGAVGFMTSRRQHAWVEAAAVEQDSSCWSVGTVGLSNALRAGDPTGDAPLPGTINLLICCSQALTPEAALELIALISEAKALAVLNSGVTSIQTGQPATGTGTDYLAVAWPAAAGERLPYAGKHTAVGSAAARAAVLAVSAGIQQWRQEYRR